MPDRATIERALEDLRSLVGAALGAGDPAAAVLSRWPTFLDHQRAGSVRLVAIGKASVSMSSAAAERLGGALERGVVLAVPERIGSVPLDARLVVHAADHPLPTERNVAGARAVQALVESCTPDHTLLVLISGGGSAHLTLPAAGLTLEDLRAVNRALQHAGAEIQPLNAVRKHTEELKGGRLAASCRAGSVVSLVLSDVIGDDLSTIASGPTAPDPTTYAEALEVLRRFGCEHVAPAVTRHLREGAAGRLAETPKPGDPGMERVRHTIVANNRTVVEAVAARARRLGYATEVLEDPVLGEARDAGARFARQALTMGCGGSAALVAGGEPVVRVGEGAGRGGPSQEFALGAALALGSARHVAILAFSTDGVDGNSDAAGALLPAGLLEAARARGLDAEAALARHDATACLDALGAALRTGPTGTNLNHVFVALTYGGA